jgi:hypothetical protein
MKAIIVKKTAIIKGVMTLRKKTKIIVGVRKASQVMMKPY